MIIKLTDIQHLQFQDSSNRFPIDNNTAEYIVDLLNNNIFNTILDLGSGTTTRILSYYKDNINPNCEIYTVDNSQEWMDKLSDITNINKLIFDNHYSKEETYYIGLNDYCIENNLKFDLIIVDGPFSYGTQLARTNILGLFENNNILSNATIIIHDTNREGEQNLINKIKILTENMSDNINYMSSVIINKSNK